MIADSPRQSERAPRRWPQFSLRTIFIAVAVVAVITALATQPFSDVARQVTTGLVAAAIFVTIGVVAAVCVFWLPLLLIIWVRSIIVRRWRRTWSELPQTDST
jgi:hypothetical protein